MIYGTWDIPFICTVVIIVLIESTLTTKTEKKKRFNVINEIMHTQYIESQNGVHRASKF